MSKVSRAALFGLGLVATWAVVSDLAIGASLRPTYHEYRLKLEPTIEWSRVAFVWIIVAAELMAFAWLVTRVRRANPWAERLAFCSIGLLAVVAAVIDAPSHAHGAAESGIPASLAPLLGALLVVALGAMGLVRGARAVGRRIRARAD